MSGIGRTVKKIFTAPGTGGQEANLKRQEQSTANADVRAGEMWNRAKSFWPQYDAANQAMTPLRASSLSYLANPTPLKLRMPAQFDPSTMPASYLANPTTYVALSDVPDWKATGQQYQDAYQQAGTQQLNQQFDKLSGDIQGDLTRRGLTGSSLDATKRAGMVNAREQADIANRVAAMQGRLGIEASLRGESTANALKAEDLRQTETNDALRRFLAGEDISRSRDTAYNNALLSGNAADQTRYWNTANFLARDLGGLREMGNPTSALAGYKGVTNSYGDIARTYGNMANQNAQELAQLLRMYGQMYAAGA